MLSNTFTDLKKHREQAIKAIRPANILQVRGAVAEVESA